MNQKKMWAALAAALVMSAPSLAAADTTTYVPEDEIKQNEAEAALGEGRLDGTFGHEKCQTRSSGIFRAVRCNDKNFCHCSLPHLSY